MNRQRYLQREFVEAKSIKTRTEEGDDRNAICLAEQILKRLLSSMRLNAAASPPNAFIIDAVTLEEDLALRWCWIEFTLKIFFLLAFAKVKAARQTRSIVSRSTLSAWVNAVLLL